MTERSEPTSTGGTGFYAHLGVRRVVNAVTTLTAVGGSLMPPQVLAAMADAAGSFVDIHELHEAAGRRLAELTHNEAAHVTAGRGAAIVLAVLACATRGDLGAIARMPAGDGMPTEVVVHAAHRIPYDPAITLAGGRIVQVGNVIQTYPWELDAAISDRTAAADPVLDPVADPAGHPAVAGISRHADAYQLLGYARDPGDCGPTSPPIADWWPMGCGCAARCAPAARTALGRRTSPPSSMCWPRSGGTDADFYHYGLLPLPVVGMVRDVLARR